MSSVHDELSADHQHDQIKEESQAIHDQRIDLPDRIRFQSRQQDIRNERDHQHLLPDPQRVWAKGGIR